MEELCAIVYNVFRSRCYICAELLTGPRTERYARLRIPTVRELCECTTKIHSLIVLLWIVHHSKTVASSYIHTNRPRFVANDRACAQSTLIGFAKRLCDRERAHCSSQRTCTREYHFCNGTVLVTIFLFVVIAIVWMSWTVVSACDLFFAEKNVWNKCKVLKCTQYKWAREKIESYIVCE